MAQNWHTIPPQVQATFDAIPPAPRAQLLAMRDVILSVADSTGTAPLDETLKWGQPAYVPPRKSGTTIRLWWSDKTPDHCALYVHCQTDLVGRYQQLFPTEFVYVDNRAVLVPINAPFSQDALGHIAAMALTYHRDKAKAS